MRTAQRCCMPFRTNPRSNKTMAIWPLTSHLTNHLGKMNKTCWALLEKQGRFDDDENYVSLIPVCGCVVLIDIDKHALVCVCVCVCVKTDKFISIYWQQQLMNIIIYYIIYLVQLECIFVSILRDSVT